jgi:hypothetical protein
VKWVSSMGLRHFRYLVSSVMLTALVLVQTINQSTFSHDFSSYVAPISTLLNTGSGPYTEFWDIKPVYLYMILSAFFSVLGISLISAYIIYGFCLLVFFLCIHSWTRFLLPKIKTQVVSLILLISFVLSDWFHEMFFPSEIVGLVLVLLSILLLRGSVTYPRIFFGITFATIAGQTKEVYIFCAFALVVYLLINKKGFFKVVLSFIFSNIVVALGGIFFLQKSGALSAYIETTSIKGSMFQLDPTNSFIQLPMLSMASYLRNYTLLGLFTPILFGLLIFLVHINKFVKFKTHRRVALQIFWTPDLQLLLLVLGAVLAGLVWQGKVPTQHYALSLLPFMLLAMLVVLHQQTANSFALALLAILIIAPSAETLETSSRSVFNNVSNSKILLKRIISSEGAAKYEIPISRCLQVAYGWESGAYYYYSKSQPCSRYFLSPLIAGNPRLTKEFRREMIKSAPSEILYITEGAGLDVLDFEESVFPYSRILRSCYTITDSEVLFKSRFKGLIETSDCIKSVL